MSEEKPEPQITQKPVETAEVAAKIEPVGEKPAKPWLKIFLFSILGIVLAAGLVFAGYKFGQLRQIQPGPQPTPAPEAVATPTIVATPTPDLTANWKTYTNTKAGFSIKHPDSWYINLGERQTGWILYFSSDRKFPTSDMADVNKERDLIFFTFSTSGSLREMGKKLEEIEVAPCVMENHPLSYFIEQGMGRRIKVGGYDTIEVFCEREIPQNGKSYSSYGWVDKSGDLYFYSLIVFPSTSYRENIETGNEIIKSITFL